MSEDHESITAPTPTIQANDSPKQPLPMTIWIGYILGAGGLAGLFVCAWRVTGTDHVSLNFLACILGGALGCAIGIYLSPYEGEAQEFSQYAKAISVFFSGYVLAKTDRVVDQVINQGQVGFNFVARIMLFACALLLVALFWFVARRYVGPYRSATASVPEGGGQRRT
jgi:hypothetical protein